MLDVDGNKPAHHALTYSRTGREVGHIFSASLQPIPPSGVDRMQRRSIASPVESSRKGLMFHDRLRALIERNCLLIREDTEELGQSLAQCDPSIRTVDARDLGRARDLSGRVWERAAAIGLREVEDRARVLDAALGVLQTRVRIEPWNMAEVMALQAELAAVVDELQAENSALYASCSAPQALEVAPLPSEARA